MELGGRPQHWTICNITWDNNPARLNAPRGTLTLSTRPTPLFLPYLHGIGGMQDELTERSDITLNVITVWTVNLFCFIF